MFPKDMVGILRDEGLKRTIAREEGNYWRKDELESKSNYIRHILKVQPERGRLYCDNGVDEL